MRHILATCLLISSAVHAQAQTTRVPDALSCARCQIANTTLAVLGTADGPGSLRGFGLVRIDGAGRFWIIHPPDLPVVFDSTGKPVTTAFRKGSGPGEFQFTTSPLALPGDSTLAIEYNRATLLGPDLRSVRVIQFTTTLSIYGGVVLRWPSRVLLNGYAPSRQQEVEPLAFASITNSTLRTAPAFGSHPGEAKPMQWEARSSLARDGNNVWAAQSNRYRLTLWDTAGRIVRVLERTPSWFAQPSNPYGGRIDSEPVPFLESLTIDEKGLLWVFINVAAPTWRDAVPKLAPGQREIAVDAIDHEKRYRTIVEVIDPRAGRVVARKELDQYVVGAFSGRRAAFYSVDAAGAPHYTIIRLALSGQ